MHSDPIVAAAKAALDASHTAKAKMLFEEAAAAGKIEVEVELSRLYLEGAGGLPPDYASAISWAQKAADAGNSRGQLYLGKIWMDGLGVLPDRARALGYFRQADAAGDLKAARYIGLLAAQQGDAITAAEWFLKGAEAGDITSQHHLGRALETGAGVMQDFTTAMKWYSKAAERGDLIASDGMVGMASLYEKGEVVEVDLGRAIALYRQAADLGNKKASAALARLRLN